MQSKAEEATTCESEKNRETTMFKMEVSLDRCLLCLIENCCKGDKLVRATELVAMLSLEKSLQDAIKLANVMKLPILAERFNALLEDKILKETMDSIACKTPTSDGPYLDSPVYLGAKQVSFKTHAGDIPHLQGKPHDVPLETKTNEASLESKYTHGSLGLSKNDTRAEVDALEATRKEHILVNGEGKKSADSQVQAALNNGSAQKPGNPFSKASNASANQTIESNGSLFNSIKKMKSTAENEGKRKDRAGSGSSAQKPSKQAKK